MNLHHLELFFHVARHRGIVNACRAIPYGIQQPAVSAQILALEGDLGVKLFRRRPFELTSRGRELYDAVSPFFLELPKIEARMRGRALEDLRIAGPGELLRYHLPGLFESLKTEFPNARLHVYERRQADGMEMVERGEAGVAVSVREGPLPPGYQSRDLAELPMVLLHRRGRKRFRGAAGGLRRGLAPGDPLIAPPAGELLTRAFQSRLGESGVDWPVGIEAAGLDQIAAYVRQGLGIGLWVDVPGASQTEGVRMELLKDFPGMPIHVFWKGERNALEKAFLKRLEKRAKHFMGSRPTPGNYR